MNTCRQTPRFSRNQPKLSARNPFRCNTYRLHACNPFIRNTYKKQGEEVLHSAALGSSALSCTLLRKSEAHPLSLHLFTHSFAQERSTSPFLPVTSALYTKTPGCHPLRSRHPFKNYFNSLVGPLLRPPLLHGSPNTFHGPCSVNSFIRNTYRKHRGGVLHAARLRSSALSCTLLQKSEAHPFSLPSFADSLQKPRDGVTNAIPNSEREAKRSCAAAVASTARRDASRRVSVGGRGFSRDIQSPAKKIGTLVLRIRDDSPARAETVFPALSAPSGLGLGAPRPANPLATTAVLGVSTPPQLWRLS